MSDEAKAWIVIWSLACLTVVGCAWAIAWAKVSNEPIYATGVDARGWPWCNSRQADRPCPQYAITINGVAR